MQMFTHLSCRCICMHAVVCIHVYTCKHASCIVCMYVCMPMYDTSGSNYGIVGELRFSPL